MKKQWTKETALTVLNASGAEIKGKVIRFPNGLKGLTGCSALDYLVNYCGYIS